MSAPPTDPQNTQAAILILTVIASGLCVFYWRTALRVILILVLALIVYGTIAGLHGLSVLTTHHGTSRQH
jgi:fructose-specific phosphotransferase system IIC component